MYTKVFKTNRIDDYYTKYSYQTRDSIFITQTSTVNYLAKHHFRSPEQRASD